MTLNLYRKKLDLQSKNKSMETKENPEEKNEPKTVEIGEFAACLMTMANVLHKHHLSIKGPGSYATHVALNEIYDALPGHADDIVELYQGYYGTLIEEQKGMDEEEYLKMSPLEAVSWLLNYVEEYRKIFDGNSMLQNQVDELLATIAKAKYKLTFLS